MSQLVSVGLQSRKYYVGRMDAALTTSEVAKIGIILPSGNLVENLNFYVDQLGFRVETIHPADAPTHATIIGHGFRIHLEPDSTSVTSTTVLRISLPNDHPLVGRTLIAPHGVTCLGIRSQETMIVPPLVSSMVVDHQDSKSWHVGRAGMMYRDLVPDRQGGSVIASHIRIESGGDVPDYVHFHDVLFQLIFCRSGWVRVVYEDQGESFVLRPGDCVIQPPTIRHRVLESGDDLEVIEIGYPAVHVTQADPSTQLPSVTNDASRTWGEQSFVRHIDSQATWVDMTPGITMTDTNIAAATKGLASVEVLRCQALSSWSKPEVKTKSFVLIFVLFGDATVRTSSHGVQGLRAGSSMVIPPGDSYTIDHELDSKILSVTVNTTI